MSEIKLYDKMIPKLSAGEYSIETNSFLLETLDKELNKQASQHIKAKDVQKFNIKGDRWRINPNDIASTYPCKNAVGDFGNDLPFITFYRKTLPWLRSKGENHTPWMAVLLLTEKDLELTKKEITLQNKQVKKQPKLIPTIDREIKEFVDLNITNPNILSNKILEESIDSDTEKLQTIRLSPEYFTKDISEKSLYSNRKEMLEYISDLCHVREVNLEHSNVDKGHTADNGIKNGIKEKSVIICSELPKIEQRYFAYLISLEGFDILKLDNNNFTGVEVIALHSWSFTTKANGFDCFEKSVNALFIESDEKHTVSNTKELLLRESTLKNKKDLTNINDTSADGYINLKYCSANNKKSNFWFKGPLSPQKVEVDPKIINKSVTDFSEIKTNVNTQHYYVAWQLGRLLALSNKSYIQAKLKYKNHFKNSVLKEYHYLNSSIHKIKGKNLEENVLLSGNYLNEEKIDIVNNIINLGLASSALEFEKQAQKDDSPHEEDQFLNKNLHTKEIHSQKVSLDSVLDSYRTNNLQKTSNDKNPIINSKILKTSEDQSDVLDIINAYQAEILLLKHIPFYYFVNNEKTLPVDSLKFFHIDSNWMHAVIMGASSVGYCPKVDMDHEELFFNHFKSKRVQTIQRDRSTILGMNLKSLNNTQKTPVFGFFIRSSFISHYPGAKFLIDDTTSPLRIQKYGDTILMCLFDKIPTKNIIITEADHGLRYGLAGNNDIKIQSGKSSEIAIKLTKKRQQFKLNING